MTDKEKERIADYRREGYGYTRIASKLGISQNGMATVALKACLHV